MGVDVVLWCYNEKKVTQEKLDKLNKELGLESSNSLFGIWNVFKFNKDDVIGDFINFDTTFRYYGERYARGNFEVIKHVIDVMRNNIGIPHYGTDNDEKEDIREFSEEEANKLYKFYLENGNDPYNKFFDTVRSDKY